VRRKSQMGLADGLRGIAGFFGFGKQPSSSRSHSSSSSSSRRQLDEELRTGCGTQREGMQFSKSVFWWVTPHPP